MTPMRTRRARPATVSAIIAFTLAAAPGCATQVVQVAAGRDATCARLVTGEVRCWGENPYGKLGAGDADIDHLRPAAVVGLRDAVHVAVGQDQACAVRATGEAVCWGDNLAGQLGNGTRHASAVPVAVAGVAVVVEAAAGSTFSCARLAAGGIRCWGGNALGSLGDGSTDERPGPVEVAEVGDAVRVVTTALGAHVCALRRSGGVICWGADGAGQAGRGLEEPWSPPAAVVNLDDAVDLAAGAQHTCALRRSGRVVCWGSGERGQLGDGRPVTIGRRRAEPAEVVDLADAVELAAGDFHSCARRRSGAVVCWGDNEHGQLGQPPDYAPHARPAPVVGIDGTAGLALGAAHSCARLRSGAVVCWGTNARGQLGDGTRAERARPAPVAP
jgi:alpha-tubulin suppressor-like RCC1 family protein